MSPLSEALVIVSGASAVLIVWMTLRCSAPPLLVALWLLADATAFLIQRLVGWQEDLRLFTAQTWADYHDVAWKATLLIVLMVGVLSVGTLFAGRSKFPAKLHRHGATARMGRIVLIERDSPAIVLGGILVAATIMLYEAIHFTIIDKDLLWKNSVYLLLRQPESHGIYDNFGRLVFFMLRPVGIACGVLAGLFWGLRRSYLSCWYMILSIYPFLYDFAQNSRFAALMLFVIGIAFVASRRPSGRIVGGIMFGLAFLAFVKVLLLRNSPFQGIAGAAAFWEEFVGRGYTVEALVRGVALNVFQTTQTLANAILLGGEYDLRYKLASFSPFPSIIDGMGEYVRKVALRVNRYVPYNSLAEAFLFGPGWLFSVYVLALGWSAWATRRWVEGTVWGRASVLVSMLGVVQFLQYPLRNTLRYFVLGIILDTGARVASAVRGVSRRSVMEGRR